MRGMMRVDEGFWSHTLKHRAISVLEIDCPCGSRLSILCDVPLKHSLDLDTTCRCDFQHGIHTPTLSGMQVTRKWAKACMHVRAHVRVRWPNMTTRSSHGLHPISLHTSSMRNHPLDPVTRRSSHNHVCTDVYTRTCCTGVYAQVQQKMLM